jgi:ABC-type uncharacterized transport system substrate-binding protein
MRCRKPLRPAPHPCLLQTGAQGAASWPRSITSTAIQSFTHGPTFRKGLNQTGHVEGQDVTVKYHWLEGQYDRLPALMADLVRRQVAVIATPGSTASALAAKAATTTIPIVFSVVADPIRLGLVASLARPGGNATGINFFNSELAAKRLRLLHDLVPKAVRIAVLVNPANASVAETTLREINRWMAPDGACFRIAHDEQWLTGFRLQLPEPWSL